MASSELGSVGETARRQEKLVFPQQGLVANRASGTQQSLRKCRIYEFFKRKVHDRGEGKSRSSNW